MGPVLALLEPVVTTPCACGALLLFSSPPKAGESEASTQSSDGLHRHTDRHPSASSDFDGRGAQLIIDKIVISI